MLKVYNNNHDNENKYNTNEKLDSSSEEIIYQEYIICLKKTSTCLSIVMYTLYLLSIIYVLDQLATSMKFVLIFTASLSSLMITCYSGQKIMDENQSICHAHPTLECSRKFIKLYFEFRKQGIDMSQSIFRVDLFSNTIEGFILNV